MKSKLTSALGIILSLSVTISAVSFGQNKDILLTVHDRKITKSEFLYYYQKNFRDSEIIDIDSYLAQFIDMHLKLAQAREENLHRKFSLMNETINYRVRLAEPYLTHKEKEDELAREAYERLLQEVKASHILVRIESEDNPEDTLKAYHKALKLREKILNGKPFEQLAIEFSDDNNVSVNAEDLGYLGIVSVLPDNQELPSFEKMKGTLIKWIRDAKDIRTVLFRM